MNQRPQKHRQLLTSSNQHIPTFEVKSYIKPSHSSHSQHPQLDFGTLNEFKLDDLIDIRSDGFTEYRKNRLAYVEENAVHLEAEGLQMLERYGKSELAFIGLYGRSGAGKSLMLDKIANLCQIEGRHFSHERSKNHPKGLYMGSVPLSKGSLKIFTLDIDGYEEQQKDSYFQLLDLMLLMSSAFMVLSGKNDIAFEEMQNIGRHVSKSRKRFRDDSNRLPTYWPQNLYCLFRNKIVLSKSLQNISQLFDEFNFSSIGDAMDPKSAKDHKDTDLLETELKKYGHNKKLLSESYISRISSVVRDIYYKLEVKSYMNFRYTGTNLAKLAVNAVQSLNLKNQLTVQKVFLKSMKQLYVEAYNYHTQMYNQCLVEYLQEEEPLEVDYLMKVFQQCSEEILGSFNQLKVNEELLELYNQKLEKYIGEKEKCVIDINKKKTRKKIKQNLPSAKQIEKVDQYAQLITRAKSLKRNDQQVLAETMSKHILSGMKSLDSYKPQIDPLLVQKSVEYSKEIELRRSQLDQIVRDKAMKSRQVGNNQAIRSTLQTRERKLDNQLEILRSELPLANSVIESARKSKSMEKLRIQQIKLQKGVERRQKIIEDLRAQSSNISNQTETTNQMIAQLMRQIELKQAQQKELAGALSPQKTMTSIQVIRSHTSLTSGMSIRKTQSRPFKSNNANIRIVPSSKT